MTVRGSVRAAAAALACVAGLAIPASAARAAGAFTHVVCADAATGRGVDADGRLPSGITLSSSHTVGADAALATRCAGAASAASGVPIRVGIAYTTPTAGDGNGTLIYRPPANTTVRAATVWTAGRNGPATNHTSMSLHGGDPPEWVYGPPVPLFCGWFQSPCASFGSLTEPFAAGNRVAFDNVPAAGFYLTLACDVPGPGYGCTFDTQELRLFAARVVLADTSNPVPSTVSGSLTSAPVLVGPQDITLNAADAGAGVYRLLVRVDGQLATTRVIDANGGTCKAVNGANADPYEFGSQTPCKGAAGGTFSVDASELPDGAHTLQVQVEDGAGNATTVVNRAVSIVAGRGAVNGGGASDGARLAVRWTRTRRTTLRTASARHAVLSGRLTDEAGRPISGARLDVFTRTTVPGAPERPKRTGPVTRPSGRFTLRMAAGVSSRDLRIAYRSHANDTAPVVQRVMRLRMRARLHLTLHPRRARQGTVVRLRGRLLTRPVPSGGKQIVLQGRPAHGRWRSFDVVRTTRRGRFAARYRFRTAGAGTYLFRAVSRFEAAYPFIAGHSRTLRVVKR